MSILNTLYSRHTTSTGTDGDEDFVDFIINLDGSLNFMLKDKQGETVALNSPKNSINLGRWYFVAASWAWDGASTSFSLQINNSSPVNRTGGTNVVAEDSTTNTAFLAKGVDIIDGVQMDNFTKRFIGFISDFTISNFVVDISALYSTR